MNKTTIRNFAIWARNKLIADVSYKAGLLGITKDGIASALPQSTSDVEFYDIGTSEPYAIRDEAIAQRKSLVNAIRQKEKNSDYDTAFNSVIEEVAYTWFNRLIAVRFMEVNDYLPAHVRVLSSESGKQEPDIVTTPFDAELFFGEGENQRIIQLKNDNKLDEVFRILFIKQCRKLSKILPELFDGINNHAEILLTLSYIDQEGVVYHLVHDIPEDDFNVEKGGQVEIIGWLYQYYNDEYKNEVININKSSIKKEEIPAATQLFTTDWIVRYIIDNTLGKYWIERNPESRLADKLDFLILPRTGSLDKVDEVISPEDIKVLDPCMGSGHFLVYAFDVLLKIYEEKGYTLRDAAKSIIENNLFGLDVDDRASQLAYFAVIMKARQYNRKIMMGEIKCNIMPIIESNTFDEGCLDELGDFKSLAKRIIQTFIDSKEYGSIIQMSIKPEELDALDNRLEELKNPSDNLSIISLAYKNQLIHELKPLVKQAKILAAQYHVVATNPPYLNKYDLKLKKYISEKYKDYSGDLFSVFIQRNMFFCKHQGYSGLMTPYVWMFIKTYEKLRETIIQNYSIDSLIQMEYSAFEEATVPICSFVIKNDNEIKKGIYIRLSSFKGGMNVQKEKVLSAISDPSCKYIYEQSQYEFSKIPGSPIAYWMPKSLLNSFISEKTFGDCFDCYVGMRTGDNARFLRMWQEVSVVNTILNDADIESTYKRKWVPFLKGGDFRRWYYNYDYVVNWKNDGADVKANTRRVYPQLGENLSWKITNEPQYFREGITFNAISSSAIGFKRFDKGAIFSNASHAIMSNESDKLDIALAFLNTSVVKTILEITTPTINYTPSDIKKLPFKQPVNTERIKAIAEQNERISREDWDSFEMSWSFKKHPLI